MLLEVRLATSCSSIVTLTEGLDNLEHEIEQFEDDPLEYIRLDLSLPSSSGGLGLGSHDAVTRRQAAADVLRALVSSGLEAETTEVASVWVSRGLQDYAANQASENGWKSKDTAVYLFTAVATRGSTVQVRLDNSFTREIAKRFVLIAWCHINE